MKNTRLDDVADILDQYNAVARSLGVLVTLLDNPNDLYGDIKHRDIAELLAAVKERMDNLQAQAEALSGKP